MNAKCVCKICKEHGSYSIIATSLLKARTHAHTNRNANSTERNSFLTRSSACVLLQQEHTRLLFTNKPENLKPINNTLC